MGKRIAFTITTKLKCRHSETDFENAFLQYLLGKDVWVCNLAYWCEFSKNTKWHAHGIINQDEKWTFDKNDDFFTYFTEIYDENKWLGYCKKSELDKGIPDRFEYCIGIIDDNENAEPKVIMEDPNKGFIPK